jgi:phosphoribosylanthranilate isomerase
MPSGPGPIPEDRIAEIAATVPPGIATFLLTSKASVADIIAQQHYCRTNTIQICDRLHTGNHEELRAALPGIRIVQVVHVRDDSSIDEAISVSRHVDALLLDSGNQDKAIKELGGTGRVHDWRLSRRIVAVCKVPVFLAGGLNPGNVADAIYAVKPFGVDVCSGLRVNGRLDEQKVSAFFEGVSDGARML